MCLFKAGNTKRFNFQASRLWSVVFSQDVSSPTAGDIFRIAAGLLSVSWSECLCYIIDRKMEKMSNITEKRENILSFLGE